MAKSSSLNPRFSRRVTAKASPTAKAAVVLAVGTKLPGPGCIYATQNLRFKAPVKAGDTVIARVTVTKVIREKKLAELKTVCTVGETVVIDGEAVVKVPSRV